MGLLSKIVYKLAGIPELHIERSHHPGRRLQFEHYSHTKDFAVMFEDDERVAYFYAVKVLPNEESPDILEAIHIYDVENLPDKKKRKIAIFWSQDGLRSCLFLDGRPEAILDFDSERGYCRNENEKPRRWGNSFAWSDEAFESFDAE